MATAIVVSAEEGKTMTNLLYEIDFVGGPFDGHRTREEWIPITGVQTPVVGDCGKIACYEWSGYRVEMVNGVPQIHHQLKFCDIRVADRNSAWRLIRLNSTVFGSKYGRARYGFSRQ
jgi:hypothetical protein